LIAVRRLAAGLALAASAAHGQSLESVLAPGPVIEAHVKAEADCRKCHIPFDRAAQDGLCVECHKDVGMDLRTHAGYHGKMERRACRSCHTDHRGRGAKIVQLDERAFDHALTDYPLRGAHTAPKVECRACHLPKKKYREAPGRCVDCHQKKDVHKGRLGPQCADCHVEDDWKKTRFDHSKTRFPLRGLHVPVKCESCHQSNRYKDTPVTCLGCHRKDDKHKARYGEKCETCHSDRGWKLLAFDHDRDTKFALRGKHRTTKCDTCHTGFLYRDKLQATCIACHRKDDKHQGTLGVRCNDCHSEHNWKVESFDHSKTRFPLLGKHAPLKCLSCHKSAVFKDAPLACYGCHRKDDKHKGVLGEKCESCHTARSWKDTKFDHAKTDFPLLGSHARVKCESCHKDTHYKATPKNCLGCHRKDDKHEGQLGAKCESCPARASRWSAATSWCPAPSATLACATRTRRPSASPATRATTCTRSASARNAGIATTCARGAPGTSSTRSARASRWTGRTSRSRASPAIASRWTARRPSPRPAPAATRARTCTTAASGRSATAAT